jgi:hypothetical protein
MAMIVARRRTFSLASGKPRKAFILLICVFLTSSNGCESFPERIAVAPESHNGSHCGKIGVFDFSEIGDLSG